MPFVSWYEKHYLRILIGVGVLFGGAAVFLAGYAKGSPKSASALLMQWSGQAAEVLSSGWEQAADPLPEHFLQPSRKPGAGVTVNTLADSDDLVLLTGFFDGDPGLRLIRRDGSPVASWRAAFSDLLPERAGKPGAPQTDWNVDLHGSYIEPDGSVLLNFEYQGTVKLSRCGAPVWSVAALTHHSVEPATGGGYWMGGTAIEEVQDAAFTPVVAPGSERRRIKNDMILRVGADGTVLARKSVFAILIENGLEPLLSATGENISATSTGDGELLHLNMIDELPPALAGAFPDFAAGDLVVSVRDFNLVFVVDPATWTVRWHSVGPWLRQHSARFLSDGTIGVFNNNAYYYQSLPEGETDLGQPRTSEILAIDPRSGKALRRYGNRPGQEMLSVFRGYFQEQPEGGFLIAEPEAGRVLQVDAKGDTVWEYINRFDAEHVLEMNNARAFPAGYFTVTDWSCP